MKRFLLVTLAVLLTFSLLGCMNKQEEPAVRNDVFTDEFFVGLKGMGLMGLTGTVSGEQMQQIVKVLQKASLTVAGDYLPIEEKPVLLIMEFEDGTAKTVTVSSAMISFNEIGAGTYLVEEPEFFTNFMKAFGLGEE